MVRRFDSVLGNSQKLDGGAMFGNAPRAMWEKWLPPDDANRIVLACRALLVREDERTLLFETGIGAFFDPAMRERFGVQEPGHVLLDNLGALGVSHEDIDYVVLSHLHFDHAGGLLTAWEDGKDSELLFPNARFLVGRTAWERAQSPHPRDRASFVPRLTELLRECGRLDIVDDPRECPLGDGYRFHESNGHTPGMLLSEISGESSSVVFCADLIPGLPWVRKAITMGYDRYPELLIDEKAALLADLLERDGHLFFTHDPNCAAAGLTRDDKGRIVAGERFAEVRDARF